MHSSCIWCARFHSGLPRMDTLSPHSPCKGTGYNPDLSLINLTVGNEATLLKQFRQVPVLRLEDLGRLPSRVVSLILRVAVRGYVTTFSRIQPLLDQMQCSCLHLVKYWLSGLAC